MKAPLSIALMISGLASYPANLAAQSRFVYANNDLFPGNNVSAFSVDATGSLAEIPNSPFATGGGGTRGGKNGGKPILVGQPPAGGNFFFAPQPGPPKMSALRPPPTPPGAQTPPPPPPVSP